MSMILAATRTITTPDLPAVDTSGLKAMLASIFATTAWFWVLLGLVLAALYLSTKTRRITKLIALGVGAILVIGWDSERHVLAAAMGTDADLALITAVVLLGAWAVWDGPKDRTAPPGGTPQGGRGRGIFGRRRGR